jgi:hypothetical protein
MRLSLAQAHAVVASFAVMDIIEPRAGLGFRQPAFRRGALGIRHPGSLVFVRGNDGRLSMMRLFPVAAIAAVFLEFSAAGAAMPTGTPDSPASPAPILVARKALGLIPANCLMDPFKEVYVCCSTDSSGKETCTEHPLDTDWPVQRRVQQFKQVKPQSQPLLLQPAQ